MSSRPHKTKIVATIGPACDAPAVLAQLNAAGRTLGLVSNTLWSPQMHDADLARFGLLALLPAVPATP